MPEPTKNLKIRELILPVYLPAMLFSIGESGLIPIIPASAERLGADIPTAGIIAGLVMAGTLVADLPAAKFVDRMGERGSMIWASATATIGILFAVFAVNIFMIGLGVFILGATAAVFGLARHSYITETVPAHQRARALSVLGGMFRIGSFVGPVIGALVISSFGIEYVYWTAVLFCGLAGVVLLFTKPEKMLNTPPNDGGSVWKIAKLHKRSLLTLGTASTIVAMSRTARFIGLPLWALHLGLDPAQASLYIGIAGAIDFSLFYLGGAIMDRFGRKAAAVPTLIGMSLCLAAVPFTSDGAGFLAIAILMALANGVGSGLVMVIGADASPNVGRNEFLAAYRFQMDSGVAATAPLMSAITVIASLATSMFFMSGLALLGAYMMWRYLPKRITA